MGWEIVCDEAELAVECSELARALGIRTPSRASLEPAKEAMALFEAGVDVALAFSAPLEIDTLVDLAQAARVSGRRVAIAMLTEGDSPLATVSLARDAGIAAVDEVRPLISAIAIFESGVTRPWAVSLAALPKADRKRFGKLSALRQSSGGLLVRTDDAGLAIAVSKETMPCPVGEARDVVEAIIAIHGAAGADTQVEWSATDVDSAKVRNIIFGPARALSDPASKSALACYGIPIPSEELCSSPSRTAAEAQRLGFPVRIALASPDLRLWDHPDLAVDGVDNATQARDVFRQIVRVAEERQPGGRILGVTVTATSLPRATLRMRLSPVSGGRVLLEMGFADPHGLAAGDHTQTVLPLSVARFERVLARLAGAALVLDGPMALRRATLDALASATSRLGAFCSDHREFVTLVEVDPLAVLFDGRVEAREACVHVGDAYERRLASGDRAR